MRDRYKAVEENDKEEFQPAWDDVFGAELVAIR